MLERRQCAPWMVFTSTARTTRVSRPSTKQESASTARPWSSKRPRVRPFSSTPQSESCAASKTAGEREVTPPLPTFWSVSVTCPAFWRRAAVPLPPLASPWYVDAIKPKSPQRQCKWLGPPASFDNVLNKLQLKKLKNEGLNVPRCVRPMYLGSRAGSHSPRYTSFATFAQMILNCFVVLARSWGWGEVLSSCGFVSLTMFPMGIGC